MKSSPEFDRYAQDYEDLLHVPLRHHFVTSDDFFHRRKWALLLDFLQRHGLSPGDLAWLDVGCGKGELLSKGRSHFGRIAGCDPSREMARGAAGLEVLVQETPDVLPFGDATFDLATAVCVYHHVGEPDRKPLTLEIRRILRPNGIFCMIEHNPFNPATQLIVKRCPVDRDARLLTAHSARHYTGDAGFRYLETQYFLYFPETLYNRMAGAERLLRSVPFGGQFAIFAQK